MPNCSNGLFGDKYLINILSTVSLTAYASPAIINGKEYFIIFFDKLKSNEKLWILGVKIKKVIILEIKLEIKT